MTADAPIAISRLIPSHESFGLVMAFLMEGGGYETANFGPLARSVAAQLRFGHHAAAFAGTEFVGYSGVVPVEPAQAERWLEDGGELVAVQSAAANHCAFALSVAATVDRRAVLPMMRALRDAHPGARVYFRRDYRGTRIPRKASLRNRG
jgi:hypothetical protein